MREREKGDKKNGTEITKRETKKEIAELESKKETEEGKEEKEGGREKINSQHKYLFPNNRCVRTWVLK
jgi:hypothetical protein